MKLSTKENIYFAAYLFAIGVVGLVAAILSNSDLSTPLGGALGALLGGIYAIWFTIKVPKSMRRNYEIWISHSMTKSGPGKFYDFRGIIIVFSALLCALFAFVWQIIILIEL